MYKNHKKIIIFIFFIIFLISFVLKANYESIANLAISVVSIALAVYIGASSVILGSPFAKKLKEQRDSEIKTKTNLGVLATYLRIAGFSSIITIVISLIYTLDFNSGCIYNLFTNCESLGLSCDMLFLLFSSFSCSIFVINIVFIWLILLFLINSLTKSVD